MLSATPVAVDAAAQLDAVVHADPAVIAAQEQLAAAHAKIDQARGAFLPVLSVSGKKDFLGQSPAAWGPANGALAYNSYRVGVVLQQQLAPPAYEGQGSTTAWGRYATFALPAGPRCTYFVSPPNGRVEH